MKQISRPTYADPDLEAAMQRCIDLYVGPGPCHKPEYIEAKEAYYALLTAKRA